MQYGSDIWQNSIMRLVLAYKRIITRRIKKKRK
jgi:hypothetical protein